MQQTFHLRLFRWEYLNTRADFSINVRPHPRLVSKAFADYVKKVIVRLSSESQVMDCLFRSAGSHWWCSTNMRRDCWAFRNYSKYPRSGSRGRSVVGGQKGRWAKGQEGRRAGRDKCRRAGGQENMKAGGQKYWWKVVRM